MTTWWDTVNDPDETAARRLAAGVGCGLLPFLCLGQEAREGAIAAGEAADRRLTEIVSGEAGGGGILEELRETVRVGSEGLARPLNAAANILKWYAISIGVLIAAVVLGLVIWFVALPLAGLGGPRRMAASG